MTTEAPPTDAVGAVRMAVEEHVPDHLHDALAARVAALAKEHAKAALDAAEAALAAHNIELANALEAAEGSLNGQLRGQDFDALLIAACARPEKAIGRTAAYLLEHAPAEPRWAIPGVAAEGWLVKVAGREKSGKGLLVWITLGQVERGEATAFGAATKRRTALILTEEPEESVHEKLIASGLKEALIVYGWELAAMTWAEKVAWVVARSVEEGHKMLFVDNLSRSAGIEDEAGVEMPRAVEKLGDAARAAGLTTIFDHHHRKGAGKLDDKSRGGTGTAGATDNNIEIERVGGWDSRVRRISSRGRMSCTIWQRQVALNDEGNRYESVADTEQPQSADERHRLRSLGDFPEGITAPDYALVIGKSPDTARRALEAFVLKGWARAEGSRPVTYYPAGQGAHSSFAAKTPPDAAGGMEF